MTALTDRPRYSLAFWARRSAGREWRGISHQVSVLKRDFFSAASAIFALGSRARDYGTQWSGPLFFGLKRSHEESRDGAR